ncbi:MAG: hypothetical protein IJW99_12550 [Clostridia bacterium]|nr:hypothetical protein [Clostridia bacterium]
MVVRDMILVVAFLGVAVFGFFVMKRLDNFLDGNRKRMEQEKKKKEPSCVMLTADMTDEEIIKNIRTYEKQRGVAYIAFYQDEDELFDGKR